MLHKTRGIVFRTIRYNDKAVIATIYTELFGLQGYLIHTGKNKKTALFQPLTCLEITVQNKANSSLQRIKEVQCAPPFSDIPYNTSKSSLAIFMAEVLFRTIKEEECNLPLFNFLQETILMLDDEKNNCSNFHLAFLVELSHYLGIHPGNEYTEKDRFFDMEESIFVKNIPNHPNFIGQNATRCLAALLNSSIHTHHLLTINKIDRKELLVSLMNYYKIHVHGMSEIKSHRVLEEVMA